MEHNVKLLEYRFSRKKIMPVKAAMKTDACVTLGKFNILLIRLQIPAVIGDVSCLPSNVLMYRQLILFLAEQIFHS